MSWTRVGVEQGWLHIAGTRYVSAVRKLLEYLPRFRLWYTHGAEALPLHRTTAYIWMRGGSPSVPGLLRYECRLSLSLLLHIPAGTCAGLILVGLNELNNPCNKTRFLYISRSSVAVYLKVPWHRKEHNVVMSRSGRYVGRRKNNRKNEGAVRLLHPSLFHSIVFLIP